VKIVILDRDGVINEDSDEYIKSPEEWIAIPGSLEAISQLNHEGYRVLVVTNQSGLGRGLFDIHALNAIHQKMYRELSRLGGHIDCVLFCPHRPDEGCRCRKPSPGLFEEIAHRFHSRLEGIPVIGDSLKDVQVARAVGARPILVLSGKGKRTVESTDAARGVPTFPTLADAVDTLLSNN
jgi:D-glycero-D-manno-heptose 1,7-bisphosphate phosphatase